MGEPILDTLLASSEPSIRWKPRVHVLGESRASAKARALQREIRDSPRVPKLLGGLSRDYIPNTDRTPTRVRRSSSMGRWSVVAGAVALVWATSSAADSVDARCDVYPAGSDHTDKTIRCTFSQRQGSITITREDGVTHELSPVGDAPGNFRDQQGRTVYRQSGLGDQGLIFRLPEESVYVYWSTAALEPQDENNPTAPFSTKDYDATTLLRCRDAGDAEFGRCPAGALRMEDGQASVVIQNQRGEPFTINFMKDYVNATNREAQARLEGDTWIVTIDGGEVYEVPLALIQGG